MANVLTAKPFVLDGTMAQSLRASQGLSAGQEGMPIRVKAIVWENPGAAGAGAYAITEPISGKVLAQGNAPLASNNPDQEQTFQPPLKWRDFQLTTFSGGGKLIIHWDRA